jgi:hypothetical protein
MTTEQIAQKLGKSKSFVNKVANGQATLSVEELGKLTVSVSRTLGSPIVKKISEITMEDVHENLEKAKEAVGDALKGIVKNAPSATANASKKVLKTTGRVIEAAGQFLQGFGH